MEQKVQEKQDNPYPIVENAELVVRDDLFEYLRRMFDNVRWAKHHFINLRGIGEKGTPKEGKHNDDVWIQPGLDYDVSGDEMLYQTALQTITTWAQYHVAAFMVPCVLNQARGISEAVELFTAVQVDLDTGDTDAKCGWLGAYLGQPSMIVNSGGVTETGHLKRHVYYVLKEPVEDVPRITAFRQMLAEKAGGDQQFGRGRDGNPLGRAHQPIRIPGSVHAKYGKAVSCKLDSKCSGPDYDFDDLEDLLKAAPPGPWAPKPLEAVEPGQDLLAFSPTNSRPDIRDALLVPVAEGGEDRNRWGQFNRVAGHYIHCVRVGQLSIDEAKASTHGWMLANMAPPWPQERFEREWHAMVGHDRATHGGVSAEAAGGAALAQRLQATTPPVENKDRTLARWATHLWARDAAPPREFLVDGLVMVAKPHLLVAEGGAGKTLAMLDLGLKIASREAHEDLSWLGRAVRGQGTVVIITTEDDSDELHRRLEALDTDGRRYRAGARLIVMPTANAGGGFCMVQRDPTGRTGASIEWRSLLAQLRTIPDLKLVVIDTLNSTLHGEENSATVINEYMRELQPVCGEMKAALVVTHHIRKPVNTGRGGVPLPIKTPDEMFAAIRGSSALPAAVRAVLGIWHADDYVHYMTAMGAVPRPKQLYRFAVLKANNPEMMEGVGFLLRDGDGMLQDCTRAAYEATRDGSLQQMAWFEHAIRLAAEDERPFEPGSRKHPAHPANRKNQLPTQINRLSYDVMERDFLEKLKDDGRILLCQKSTDGGKESSKLVYDVPGGPYADPQGRKPPGVKRGVFSPDWAAWRWDPGTAQIVRSDGPPSMGFAPHKT
jgi:hypothetical protein